MSRSFTVFTKEDFQNMCDVINKYIEKREEQGLPFMKLNITSKQWRKPKSSEQHRKYFSLIGKLKLLFIETGHRVNDEDVHNFIKVKMGFTKVVDGVMIVRSIADASEDATSEGLNNLIEFVLQFSIENFDVDLEKEI